MPDVIGTRDNILINAVTNEVHRNTACINTHVLYHKIKQSAEESIFSLVIRNDTYSTKRILVLKYL